MKKITIYIVLALLCLNFKAQAQDNKAVDVTLKGIQIGQKVPDITIINLHNYKDANGKPSTTAKLSDFKGKLLILDFWATWCSPCVAMIPKMDSLQKSFGDKIQFLSITYQAQEEVMPFLEKFEKQHGKHFDLPVVTDSKELHKLFPHTTLPHYVWIDGNGVVKAITESKEIHKENISMMLAAAVAIQKKSDFKIKYDNNKPFLINGNGGDGKNLLYHSVLTAFTEGLTPSYSRSSLNNNSEGRVVARNTSLLQIFRLAYGGYDKYYG
ncbi:MAG: TlpA disulfide reductase family protein, partial [Ignavibacteria bacterium]|nr:TlpA disulfide reductase family protein [Ignavibacteria bacterium]